MTRLGHLRAFASDRPLLTAVGTFVVVVPVVILTLSALMVPMCACSPETTELAVDVDSDEVIRFDGADTGRVALTVTTESGDHVSGVTVLLTRGSVALTGGPVVLGTTDETGRATGTLDRANVTFDDEQRRGTLGLEAVPPGDSDYVDDEVNPDIVVVNGTAD